MAKDRQSPDQSKVKLRFIEVELEGANSTVIDTIKNVAAAMSRGNGVQTIKTVRGSNGGASAALGAAVEVEQVDAEDDDQTIEHEAPAATAARPRPKRPISSPKILEVDFNTGGMPLEAFVEEKKPEGDTKRYLVIAYWFKSHADTPNVTVNHIHTAYRHLGWNTPKDAAQPLRDLKSKNQWFNKGDGKGEYSINHIGENIVNKMP